MKVKSERLFILSAFAFFAVLPFVLGVDPVTLALQPLQGIDIGATYMRFPMVIDAIIYFWLFIALSQSILKDKFPKQVAIVMGVILAIGMGVFETRSGFNLGTLAPFAAAIFFLIMAVMFYTWGKTLGGKTFITFSIVYIIFYGLINFAAPSLVAWIGTIQWLSILWNTLFILSIIGLVTGLVSFVKGIGSGKNAVERSEREGAQEGSKWNKLFDKEKSADKKFLNLERQMTGFDDKLSNLEQLEQTLDSEEMKNREKQLQALKQLQQAMLGVDKLQKTIRQVYKHIADPEYDKYKDQLQQYGEALERYMIGVRTYLAALKQSIEVSEKIYKQESDADKEIDNELKILEKDLADLDNAMKTFVKDVTDIDPDPAAIAQLNALILKSRNDIQLNLQMDTQIVQIDENLKNRQETVDKIDKFNINIIDKALTIANLNSAERIKIIWKKEMILDVYKNETIAQINAYLLQLIEYVTQIVSIEKSMEESKQNKIKLLKQGLQNQKNIYNDINKDINQITDKLKNDYLVDKAAMVSMQQFLKDQILPLVAANDYTKAMKQLSDFNLGLFTRYPHLNTNNFLKKILHDEYTGVMMELRQKPNKKKPQDKNKSVTSKIQEAITKLTSIKDPTF